MGVIALLLLAVGLSMDTFAVSLTAGVVMKPFRFANALKVAVWMALFQGGMPLLGWLLEREFISLIEDYDHWIAFGLLVFLGAKMIYEALFSGDEIECFSPTKTLTLIQLGVATSIDALAIGVSFGLMQINMVMAVSIIAAVTLVFSLAGCYIGKFFGTSWKRCATVIGGLILIGLGIRIVVEHTCI